MRGATLARVWEDVRAQEVGAEPPIVDAFAAMPPAPLKTDSTLADAPFMEPTSAR